MTHTPDPVDYDHVDAEADRLIAECVAASPPTSFFLFAGAGSGKTQSLVEALEEIRSAVGPRLRLHGRRVGVITFTNKACDEIKDRLKYDNLFMVSTVHSFAWSLIKGLNRDIREYLRANLQTDILELEEKERKGRGGKASVARMNTIAVKRERLSRLDGIRRFVYNPDGDNPEVNALSHAEVITITATFLRERPLMQSMLVNRFPILLIDESQDTNRELIESLFHVQGLVKDRFALGIIGDMMQRIYPAGKVDLDRNLPADWAKPAKKMNHRSARRIIELINRIRKPVDNQEQRPRSDRGEGYVRLFILPAETPDKPSREREICMQMAGITGDGAWSLPGENVKTLILEHHMAAARLGFLPMWDCLDRVDRLTTGLRDGKHSLPALRFFSHLVLPCMKAHQDGRKFAVASIVRKDSPLLEKRVLEACGVAQRSQLEKARVAVYSLAALWAEGGAPTFHQVLRAVSETGLFRIPESLRPFINDPDELVEDSDEAEETASDELRAWSRFLETPFAQIEPYSQYIQGEAQYGTHQGIKGLEFPRVCVVMDDSKARGFMFSYEKLFGAKEEAGPKEPGQETSVDRTRRLFYVTCSRAKDALALIAYTSKPDQVRNHVLRQGWFTEEEIILMTGNTGGSHP